jgi:transposase
VEVIAPHRKNRRPENKTQDGRKLRRYKRRWLVERFFAWLGNCRRLLVRHERRARNYEGFAHLATLIILVRNCF